MAPLSRRTAGVLIVAVVSLLCVVAVLGVSVESGDPDPATTRESVVETNRSVDAYEATLRITTRAGNRTRTMRFDVAVDRPGRQNLTMRPTGNRSGFVFVSNRSGAYSYDRGNATLRKLGDARTTPDILAQFVRALGGNGTEYRGEDRIQGSSGVVLKYSAGGENVGLRIGGSAPSLRYATRGRTEDVDVSVWVDPERDLPVRLNQSYTIDGRRVSTTMELTDLDLDPSLSADRFRIDLPPGADVIDRTNLTRSYDSLAALRRNVSLPVPDPSLPEGFAFERGTVVRADDAPLALVTYADDRERISVQASRRELSPGENATEVAVGNATGYYRDLGSSETVRWRCGDVTFVVGGTVDRETLLSVARSIACRSGVGSAE